MSAGDVRRAPSTSRLSGRKSLRWRLPLLVAGLTALTLAAFLWAAHAQLERTLVEAGRVRAQGAAQQVVSLLAPGIQQRTQEIRRAAADPALTGFLAAPNDDTRAAAEVRLAAIVSTGQHVIEIRDATGAPVMTLAQPAAAADSFPPSQVPAAAGVRFGRAADGRIVSDVIERIASADSDGTGEPRGYLVMRRPVAISPPGILARLVGDGARVRLGSAEGNWTDLIDIVDASPLERAGPGVGEFRTVEGDARLGVVVEIAGTPWLVSVDYPREVFVAPARTYLNRTGLIAIALIAVAGLLSQAATARITRSLTVLTDASEAIAAGDYGRRVDDTRPDELGRLGSAFNSMVAQVQDAHEHLKLTRDDAVAQVRQAAFAADVAVALTEGGELREMLARCARAMVEHLDASVARVWTVSATDSALELQAAAGTGSESDDALTRVSIGEFAAGRVAADRQPVVDNAVDAARYASEAIVRAGQLSSYAGFPLVLGDRLVGVISMFGRKPLTESTLLALGSVARTVALGIERKRLDETRSRFEDLLESATDFVTIGRLAGPPLYINRAARQALGIAPTEQVTSLLAFRPPEVQQLFESHVLPTVLREGMWRGQTQYISKSGRVIPVSQVSIIHKGSDGDVQYLSTIARDISDELRAADERETLEEQLRRTQRLEAIGQLAGGLAHDFNNLLTVILGYTNMLADAFDSHDPRLDDLEQIRRAGERASQLTRQLLAFTRQQVLNPAVLDPNTLIEDMRPMLKGLLGEAIRVVINCDPVVHRIRFDPAQLELILVNLAVNARDAMPQGGTLTIDTANVELDEEFCRTHLSVEPGRYVRLSVTDTGIGIDEETKKRIFEPFFTTKGRHKGTGLGLATVFGVLKQSGGSVWVYSEPGLGASFKLFLPVAEEAAPIATERRTQRRPTGSETILLVEDEGGVRHLVKATLTRAGYTVLSASHPAEALRIAANADQHIDLLLTDVVMPDCNGASLSRDIRRVRPGLRVLFMSGFADESIEQHGVFTEGTVFLQKPFTVSDLACKVRQVLDQAAVT